MGLAARQPAPPRRGHVGLVPFPCTASAGIFVEDGEILELAADLQPLNDAEDQSWAAAAVQAAAVAPSTEEFRLSDGAVVAWTDGGCTFPNRDPLFRRAGSGAWWGPRHPLNRAFPVTGPAQSNNRAELAAVLYAVRVEPRLLEVRTDSQYVHDHWAALNDGAGPAPSWSHRDLWELLADALRARSADAPARLRKVKGHASAELVSSGHVRPEDKLGNGWADALATEGLAKLQVCGPCGHLPGAGAHSWNHSEMLEARMLTRG